MKEAALASIYDFDNYSYLITGHLIEVRPPFPQHRVNGLGCGMVKDWPYKQSNDGRCAIRTPPKRDMHPVAIA
jgi:hypothetical protein